MTNTNGDNNIDFSNSTSTNDMTQDQNKTKECCEEKHCEKCGSVDYFQEIADGFWSMCEWNGTCYEWLGTVSTKGYGVISFKGRQWKAHRVAKSLSGEFLPHWLVIDHLCKNTICVNPGHLRICTSEENVMAGESFGPKNASKTHCIRGHDYKIHGELQKARKGNGVLWRKCTTCSRNNRKKLKAKLKNKNG